MKRTAWFTAATATSPAAAGVLTGGTASAHDRSGGPRAERDSYGTRAPYLPQGRPGHYQPVPKGYTAVFTENVARHGSRAMTDGEDGDTVLAVLAEARESGGLTDLGRRLTPQVRSLLAAAAGIGYGNLSGLGVQEHRQTALRLEQRLPGLFDTIAATGEPIVVETSGVARATASADAFTAGLTAGRPALADVIGAPVTDKDLLYFHKQPQNADYRTYLAKDQDLAAVLAAVDGMPRTAGAARHTVGRLFHADFAATLTADRQIAFARSLYALYSAAPDLAVEAPDVDLNPFLADRDAQWFGYLDDAEEFYQKGPAFSGRTVTHRMAGVLLADLFARAEARAAGTSRNGAVLRFTHAEEIEPLAVLLGLPGSTVPAEAGEPYSYRNNPWRGAEVSPMAANIQWDLYAGTTAGGAPSHLVRMFYNEKETAFPAPCTPVAPGSHFYELGELERCFGRA
ncbi:histidine-type phosphatase [Kitasatospora sp. NPDC007106]|uniref:histidine-type phosphatase n=1 Tax=Kitasatospora sp. NPDC007106 TaxID=3156914 RepID=UPI0033FB71E4